MNIKELRRKFKNKIQRCEWSDGMFVHRFHSEDVEQIMMIFDEVIN